MFVATGLHRCGACSHRHVLRIAFRRDLNQDAFARDSERFVLDPPEYVFEQSLNRRGINWTEGCISLFNSDIDELYDEVPLGTRVVIER